MSPLECIAIALALVAVICAGSVAFALKQNDRLASISNDWRSAYQSSVQRGLELQECYRVLERANIELHERLDIAERGQRALQSVIRCAEAELVAVRASVNVARQVEKESENV